MDDTLDVRHATDEGAEILGRPMQGWNCRPTSKKIKKRKERKLMKEQHEINADTGIPTDGIVQKPFQPIDENKFEFFLLNIQGLTNPKVAEIEELMRDRKSLAILTETQKKVNNLKINEDIIVLESMRDLKDKKGGGLMLMHWKDKEIKLEKGDTKNKDLMLIKGDFYGEQINIIVVYFSIGTAQNKEKNMALRKEAEHMIQLMGSQCTLVLGDFNGHVGFKGEQKLDDNGAMIIDWMQKYDLIMLNDDTNCKGVYTWQRNDQKSVVDFALVNTNMYNIFTDMLIDDSKQLFDLSDHNLIKIRFRVKKMCDKSFKSNNWEERDYYKLDKDSLQKYTDALERRIILHAPSDMESFNCVIRDAADEQLKAKYRRKKNKRNNECEPPWINDDIRKGIKLRQSYNRQKRNASLQEERDRAEGCYQDQKTKVQLMIKERITEHEERVAKQLRESKDIGKNMWKYIKMLKNINKDNKNEDRSLYDENGIEFGEKEAGKALVDFWEGIYQKYRNDIDDIWNQTAKQEYEERLSEDREGIRVGKASGMKLAAINRNGRQIVEVTKVNETIRFKEGIHEHMDIGMKIGKHTDKMQRPKIEKEELTKVLKKVKNKKAAGPDEIKPELYKAMLNSEICLSKLTECYNRVLEGSNIPGEWRTSRTVMIPKTNKPQAKQLRPIALTNISYKIFMSLVRNYLEEHIRDNGLENEAQSGFTDGGRIENNLFILKYCIEKSKLMKKPLIVTSIDYSKAYDSIKRGQLIQILKENKVHADLISIIAEIYKGDKTIINYGNVKNVEIPITSGIRQGCTGSTTLFKLITYKILERMENERGFIDDMFRLIVLYFADDGLILSNSVEDANRNVEMITGVSREYGLEINKDKSNTIIFGMKNQPVDIKGIKVVKEIKYLGVTINGGRDCFKKQKELMIEKANRLANQTYPIIAKSCNKIMIGKVFWKCVALPSILHGANVIDFSKTDIQKLQRIENKVYRQILGAPTYAQVSALRGEVGASSMEARIMEGKIKLLKHTMQKEDSLLGRITTEMKAIRSAKWTKNMGEYLKKTKVEYCKLRLMTKEEIKTAVREWDTGEWRRELSEKSSLEVYRGWKCEMGKMDKIYDNKPASVTLYKARTNVLPLNDRKRWMAGETKCIACEAEFEDLRHFLLYCPEYAHIRMTIPELQQPYSGEDNVVIGRYLFRSENVEKCKTELHQMWRKREKLVRQTRPVGL